MASQLMVQILVPIILLVLVAGGGATPPGIAKNPSHASCNIKKYKHCYNLVHVCPKFCPDGCTVECASCKPICVGGANPPPDSPTPTPSTPESPTPTPSTPEPENPPPSHPTTPSTPQNPPPSTPSSPENPPPTPSTPSSPQNPPPSSSTPPSSPTPSNPSTPSTTPSPTPPSSPSTPSPTPPTPSSPSTPSITPSSPTPSTPSSPSTTPSSPTPSTPSTTPSPTPPTPSSPTPSTPSTPSTTPSTPSGPSTTPSSPTPSTPSTPSTTPPSTSTPSPKTARCRNKDYPRCYNMEHVCPNACPGGCEVDCYTCKPVCKCDRPGAVCQDPRFIGGDGITFYFHGRKETNFCLVSDPNLHINGHFIGRRNHNMKRDFTWVQSIAILFDNHQLFVGASKTATWDDSVDRLALSFDGEPLSLVESQGATWKSKSSSVTIVRSDGGTNSVTVEVGGKLRVTAKVVPITEQDSRVHNYGMTEEDCFAHLDLGFKFLSLSNEVSGVLGQTYRPDYVSRVDIGAKMPVMGGGKEFETSTLFSSDCSVSRFVGNNGNSDDGGVVATKGFEVPGLSCSSGIDGQGVVCRR